MSGVYHVIVNGEVVATRYNYADILFEFESIVDDGEYQFADVEIVQVLKSTAVERHMKKCKKITTDCEYSVITV